MLYQPEAAEQLLALPEVLLMENTIIQQPTLNINDVDGLVQDALTQLKSGVATIVTHFKETGMKTTASVTVEISYNKEEDIIIKITPKLNLPQNSNEYVATFDDGTLKLM